MILTATGLTMDPSMMEEVLHRGGGTGVGGVTAGHPSDNNYERHDNTQITFRMPHFQVSFIRAVKQGGRQMDLPLHPPIFISIKTSVLSASALSRFVFVVLDDGVLRTSLSLYFWIQHTR